MVKHKNKNHGLFATLPSVNSIGISIWDPVFAEREHVSTACELVHVMNGSMVLHMEGKKCRAESGETLIIPEGIEHRDEFPLDSTFKVFHVMFHWVDFGAVIPPTINRNLVKLASGDKQKIREYITAIYNMFREDGPFAYERTNAKLYDLLLFIVGVVKNMALNRKKGNPLEKRHTLIDEAKRFIRENYEKPISLLGIADHLKLSEYYLSHLFSEEMGFSLSSYVTQVRMRAAAELLAAPTLYISEVAYAAGYENPNYFGKVFRKHFGCSPGGFRAGKLKKKRKKQP